MKKSIVIMAMLLIVFFLCGSMEAKTITLTLGHISPPTSPMGQGAERFAKLVEERTNGQIKVKVFPSEQLGPAKTMLESTMIGNQDIFLEGAVWYERFSKTLRFLMIPFVFKDREHFRKWNKSDSWRETWDEVTQNSGLVFLDKAVTWERGPFRLIVSKRPIMSLGDVRGLKMRVWPSDAYKRSWEALGAKPTELAWTDVYLGLKLGTVDACTTPVNLLYPMKFTEVAKYVTKYPEFPQVVRVAMNKQRFDSLKPQFQKILIDAANEAGELYTQISVELAESNIQKCIKEHNAVYIQINLEPFAERMRSQIMKFETEGYLPAGIYDKIRALVE